MSHYDVTLASFGFRKPGAARGNGLAVGQPKTGEDGGVLAKCHSGLLPASYFVEMMTCTLAYTL
jgi:hypothetical protein